MVWTFRDRLLAGFFVTGIALASVSAAAIGGVLRLAASNEDFIASRAETMSEAERLRGSAEQFVASGRGYLLAGHDQSLEKARAAQAGIRESLARLRVGANKARNDSLLQVESAEREYDATFERAIAMRHDGADPKSLVAYFDAEMKPRREVLEAALDAFIGQQRDVFRGQKQETRRTARDTTILIALICGSSILVALASAAIVTRHLAYVHARLEQAKQSRDTMLSVVSHELRAPLNALALQVQLLARKEELEPSTNKRLEGITNRIRRIIRLLNNLLDASRIESGRLDIELEEIDLAQLMTDLVHAAENEIRSSGCAVELRAPEPVVGTWDALRLHQVFTNVLSNALKYGAGKPVEITVAATDSEARVDVRDHGIGISPEDQRRIFEPFERGGRERDYAGFGLGLWIVKQIVEAMGGRIGVASKPGEGATFTVHLPRKPTSGRFRAVA